MSKKENNKYFLPVEVTRIQPHSWLDIKTYEYKLYSESSETKFTKIKFIDVNGFIIGEHMPTKLHTVYDKAALQVKSSTVKVVSEIKNVVDSVADIAVAAASEMKDDASKTAGIAVGLFGKMKNFAKDKFKKEKIEVVEQPATKDTDIN
jgi:hypothetical protein